MKYLILTIAAAVAMLSGCASQLQATKAMESAAAVSLRAAEDNHLDVLKFELCATPLSAAIRHPEMVPALRELCIPGGVDTSPITLLQGATKP